MRHSHWQQLEAREPSESSPAGLPQPPNIPKHPEQHTHSLLSTPTLRGFQGQRIWSLFENPKCSVVFQHAHYPIIQCLRILGHIIWGLFQRSNISFLTTRKIQRDGFSPLTIPPFPGWSDSARSNFAATPKQRLSHLSDHGHNFLYPSFHSPCISCNWCAVQ